MIFLRLGTKSKCTCRLGASVSWLTQHSRVLSAPFVVCVYGYLGLRLFQDWNRLGPTFRQAQFEYLALSSLLLFLALGVTGGRWFVTLRRLDVEIGWWESLRVWFLSQAGRYIPGSIWPYIGRVYWGTETVPSPKMMTSLALELLFRVSSETVLGALLLLFWAFATNDGQDWQSRSIILVTVVIVGHLVVIFVGPRFYEKLTLILREKIPDLEGINALRLPAADIWVQWLYYAASVAAVGIAFYFFTMAFYPLEILDLPALAGGLAMATVVGFLTPFAPNGWGIREGILVFLLSSLMPISIAVIISVTSRVWLMLIEGLWVIILVGTACPFSRTTLSSTGYEHERTQQEDESPI